MKLFSILERIVTAMGRRNEINRERLDFERVMYSSNNAINERAVKADEEMVKGFSEMKGTTDMIHESIAKLSENIGNLYTNAMYFNDEIDKLKQSLVVVQEKIDDPQ